MSKPAPNARETILWSGIELFARKGYAGTSVDEVLAGTGLSKPTLYYHFQSKAGLYRAILEFAYDEGFRLMEEGVAGAATCEEKLNGLTMAWFRFVTVHESLTRLVFATVYAASEEIPRDAVDSSKRLRNYEFFTRIIQEGRKSGELSAAYQVEELTEALYGVLSQQLRAHLFRPSGKLDKHRAKRVVGLFLQGAQA